MITEKKFLPEIHLYDGDGDLSKEWFIYWYEDGKRIRRKKGINQYSTAKGRTEAANALIEHWKTILSKKVRGFKGTEYHKQHQKIYRYLDKVGHSLKPKTLQQYKSHLRKFLEWNQRTTITPDRVEDYFSYLASIGRKQVTIHNYYRTFKVIFSRTLGDRFFDNMEVKKGNSTPAQYFSDSQVKFLRVQIEKEDPELWLAVQLILYCYIRPGELRNLKIGDILIEDKKICIPGDIAKNRKTQYIIIPDVFIDDLASAILGKNPALYLMGLDYKPIGTNSLARRHQKILKNLHFDTKRYKLYSWKHTGVKIAVDSEIHIKQLQLQLRHHSLDQVNQYLRQMGISDMGDFASKMPRV